MQHTNTKMYESRGHQLTGDKHAAYDAPSSTTASPLHHDAHHDAHHDVHHDAHHDVHRDVHHDAHHDAQQLPIAPDGDMHDTAAYHVPTHRNVTSVWVKCFSAERAAALLVDREDPLDVVRGKIEAALYPNGWAATSTGAAAAATADIKSSSTRKRLQIDYLDAYGQRVRIDSQERWNTAVATYLHMKRNFVYVFCDAYPVVNGASSKGKSGVSFGAAWSRASPSAASASAATSPAPTSTATPASSSGNTGNVPSARDTDNTIHISDERRALRLIQKATPAPPKFRRPTTSVPSWTDERLKENGVLARLQREIQHREKLLLDKRRAGTASASAASQSVRHGHDSRDAEVTTSMDSVNSEDIGARPRSVLLRVDSSYER